MSKPLDSVDRIRHTAGSAAQDAEAVLALSAEQFPALAGLRLNAADFAALALQGFVTSEKRGTRLIWKLRFRHDGQQLVRCIGDAEDAAAVRAELAELQADARQLRELQVLTRTTRRKLREAKAALAPLLASRGFAFHGQAIRRPRRKLAHQSTIS